jgi:hypothetical protein
MSTLAYQPELMKEKLPKLSIYNHATLVGGLTVPHLALKKWRQKKNKPKYILWNIGLFELSGKRSIVSMRGAKYVGPGDLVWVSQLGSAKYNVLGHAFKNGLSPVSRDYQAWRALLTGQHMQSSRPFDVYGAKPLKTIRTNGMNDEPGIWQGSVTFYRNVFTDHFIRDRQGIDVVTQFAEECKKENIQLVIVCLPDCKNYHELFHKKEDHDWAFNTLKGFCSDNKVDFWDLRDLYTDDNFSDGVHMNQKGIEQFNKDLVPMIKALVGGANKE